VAEIKPFRALRYDTERAGRLEKLVAPPFDVIGPEERERYLERSPYNVVHLTLPDSEEEAGRDFRAWREQGILAPEEPGFWVLSQDYVGPDSVARIRTGLAASLRIEPYEAGTVLPHERTHRGPKEGRLRLLREVNVQLEPIFLLYKGNAPFEVPDVVPELETNGTRLWRLEDDTLADAFADRRLLIADGHHRYETALAYHEEVGTSESAYMMVVLVSTSDPGLMIFPTHRVVGSVNGPNPTHGDIGAALRDLEARPRDRGAAVLYRRGGRISLLQGDEGQLDVELVEAHAPKDVSYTASIDDAVAAVEGEQAEGAFLVRPLRVEDVFAVAARGETMPQKSTYFYPKLVSGLLFHPLESGRTARGRPSAAVRSKICGPCSRSCRPASSASLFWGLAPAATRRQPSTPRLRPRSWCASNGSTRMRDSISALFPRSSASATSARLRSPAWWSIRSTVP
jgi:uncharacterized protein (DUF1015 family)